MSDKDQDVVVPDLGPIWDQAHSAWDRIRAVDGCLELIGKLVEECRGHLEAASTHLGKVTGEALLLHKFPKGPRP